ncbi:hypothetical protein HBI38_065040 [Parastagonospora nodorum]|nr:hypothetical protein HBH46_069090 [Parastagonospora nodorum]KAH4142631.1 hypothetical protein HBH45_054070 [Parastagonospora nodorum]KAH4156075.1 hypothetical protein HBH44_130810 [Parastagonospora nodorum]KAH4575714.1 hypothetical protein HBH84_075420 [Parastagonospora nodorum]KAH4624921.1 hypothetical protein HBH55_132590 [Parastagonospora nodorum]
MSLGVAFGRTAQDHNSTAHLSDSPPVSVAAPALVLYSHQTSPLPSLHRTILPLDASRGELTYCLAADKRNITTVKCRTRPETYSDNLGARK